MLTGKLALLVLTANLGIMFVGCDPPGIGPWPPGPPVEPPGANLIAGTVPAPQPVITPYPAPAQAAWPQFGGTPLADLRSGVNGPVLPTELRRRFSGAVQGLPVLCADGLWRAIAGRTLVSFNQAGVLQQTLPLDMISSSSGLAVSRDGTQLYYVHVGQLRAIALDGTPLWTSDGITADDWPDPHVTADDLVIVAIRGGYNFVGAQARTAAGAESWTFTPSGSGFDSFTIGPDDRMYFTERWDSNYPRTVTALDPDGSVAWTATTVNTLDGRVFPGLDGNLYVKTFNVHQYPKDRKEYVESFTAAGAHRAVINAPLNSGFGYSAIPAGPDGTLYMATQDGLTAYDQSGRKLWRADEARNPLSIRALPDGVLAYVDGFGTRQLQRYNSSGILLWQFAAHHDFDQLPGVAADGALLLADSNQISKVGLDGQADFVVTLPQGGVWQFATANDGSIYALGGQVLSLAPDLSIRWSAAQPQLGINAMLISSAGNLVLTHQQGFLVYSPQGLLLRQASVDSETGIASTRLAADDTLYCAGLNGRQIAAVELNGARRWTYTDEHYLQGTTALDDAGNLYCISVQYEYPSHSLYGAQILQQWLISLDRAGALRSRLPLPAPIPQQPHGGVVQGPQIDAEGHVLLGLALGQILRIPPAGTETKTVSPAEGATLLGPLPEGLLARLHTGTDYGLGAGDLVALNFDGSIRWRLGMEGVQHSGHFIDAAGRIYFTAQSNGPVELIALDSADGSELLRHDIGAISGGGYQPQPVPDASGAVLLASGDELIRLAD